MGTRDRQARGQTVETLAPARNFTITTEERVRALAGPPAYMRRKRHIEDLEGALRRSMAEALAARPDLAVLGEGELAAALPKLAPVVAKLNDLVERHNRYYPTEANLPSDPRTGETLERGGCPWRPLAPVTLRALVDALIQERA